MKSIPIATSFKISEDGKVFDSKGKERNYYRNGDDYVTVSVLTNEGLWVTFGVHRLLCITYKPIEDYTFMTVNHIDGDKENNTVGNVEWLTTGMNNIHNVLLNRYSKRPLIKVISRLHNKMFVLNDLLDAERYLGLDLGVIWDAIKNGTELDGYKLSFIKSNDREVLKTINDEIGTGEGYFRSVKLLDIHTGEINIYSSMHAAAREHNVIVTHIRNRLSVPERPKIFNKRYVIVDVSKDFKFLTEDVIKELLSRGSKEIVAYSLKDKEFKLYPTANQFIKENGLSKKSVTTRLKKKELKPTSDWLYSYYTDNLSEVKASILEKASSLDTVE